MTICDYPECGKSEVIRDGKHLVETRICHDCHFAIKKKLNGGKRRNASKIQ